MNFQFFHFHVIGSKFFQLSKLLFLVFHTSFIPQVAFARIITFPVDVMLLELTERHLTQRSLEETAGL